MRRSQSTSALINTDTASPILTILLESFPPSWVPSILALFRLYTPTNWPHRAQPLYAYFASTCRWSPVPRRLNHDAESSATPSRWSWCRSGCALLCGRWLFLAHQVIILSAVLSIAVSLPLGGTSFETIFEATIGRTGSLKATYYHIKILMTSGYGNRIFESAWYEKVVLVTKNSWRRVDPTRRPGLHIKINVEFFGYFRI